MAIKQMAFTMYPVTDMPRAVTFYRDVLGLGGTDVKAAYWVEFHVAGQCFGIGHFEQVGTPGTAQSFALEVDDLPAFRQTLWPRTASRPASRTSSKIAGCRRSATPTATRSGCTSPSRAS